MDAGQVVRLFVFMFAIPLGLLPAVGGGFVTLGLRLARIPPVPYLRCWKVYLASCCYGFLILVPAGYLLGRSDLNGTTAQVVRAAIFLGAQLLLVPLLLRNFSRRALGVAGLAVLLTNLAVYLLLMDFQPG
jgi:hypothetical protein